ncbi:hypothetical protein P308_07690 [Pseudomonas piscis]|nr:hypothetical protein P308_07690 [Pseudomonas piscis]
MSSFLSTLLMSIRSIPLGTWRRWRTNRIDASGTIVLVKCPGRGIADSIGT